MYSNFNPLAMRLGGYFTPETEADHKIVADETRNLIKQCEEAGVKLTLTPEPVIEGDLGTVGGTMHATFEPLEA